MSHTLITHYCCLYQKWSTSSITVEAADGQYPESKRMNKQDVLRQGYDMQKGPPARNEPQMLQLCGMRLNHLWITQIYDCIIIK